MRKATNKLNSVVSFLDDWEDDDKRKGIMVWMKEFTTNSASNVAPFKIANTSFRYFDTLKRIRNGTFIAPEPERDVKKFVTSSTAPDMQEVSLEPIHQLSQDDNINNDPFYHASAPDNYDDNLPGRTFSEVSNTGDSDRSSDHSYAGVSPVEDPLFSTSREGELKAPDELELPDFTNNNAPVFPYRNDHIEEVQKYAGIKNQGATCYLNSYIQTLFHIPYFRTGIYEMQIESGIPLELQKLFFLLQTTTDAASTKELTTSFGWSGRETDTQHDIQEFSRVLTDSLSERIKKTTSNPHDNIVRKLFRGELVNYVRCTDIDYQSRRTEEIYDLSLVVKGMGSLRGAFDEYVKEDTLDGDNKYEVEFPDGRKEKHPARRGCVFKKLPPILMCHLKRFDFDMEKLKQVKVNERFTFETEIDLTNYVEAKSGTTPQTTPQKTGVATPSSSCLTPGENELPRTSTDGSHCSLGSRQGTFFVEPEERHIYVLHSVMVHSGSIFGGHYVCYIRPNQGPWLKFDDSRVTQVSEEEAVESNFGRVYTDKWGHVREDCSNAYYLTYIRKQLATAVYSAPSEVVMDNVKARLMKEIEAQAEEERERQDARTHYKIRMISIEDIYDGYKSGISNLINYDSLNDATKTFRIVAESTVTDLREAVLERFKVPESFTINMWKINKDRVTELLNPDNKILESIFGRIDYWIDKIKEYGIFIQLIPKADVIKESHNDPQHLTGHLGFRQMAGINPTNIVFIKEYDPTSGDHPLKTIGHYVFRQQDPTSPSCEVDFKEIQREYIRLAKNQPSEGEKIICFSETDTDTVEEVQELNLEGIFTKSLNHGRGLILIFQKVLSPEYSSAENYYLDKLHLITVDVYPRPFDVIEDSVDDKKKFSIKVRTTDKIEAVVGKIANVIESSPDHTRLYSHHNIYNRPTERAIDLHELQGSLEKYAKVKKLYYDVIELPVKEAERREEIPLRVVTGHGKVLSRIKYFADVSYNTPMETSLLITNVQELHKQLVGDDHDEITDSEACDLCVIGDSKKRDIEDVYYYDSQNIRFNSWNKDISWRLCKTPDRIRNVDGSLVEDEQQEIIEVLRLVVDSNSLGKYGNTAYAYYGDGFLIYTLHSDTTESLRGRIKQALQLDDEAPTDWDIYLTNEGHRYNKLEPNEHVQAAKNDLQISWRHLKVSVAVRIPQTSEDEATLKRIKETTTYSIKRETALKICC